MTGNEVSGSIVAGLCGDPEPANEGLASIHRLRSPADDRLESANAAIVEQASTILAGHGVAVERAIDQLCRGLWGYQLQHGAEAVVDLEHGSRVLAGFHIAIACQLLAQQQGYLDRGAEWCETEAILRDLNGALVALQFGSRRDGS